MHLLKKAVEEVLTRPSSKVGGRFFGYREDGFQGDRDVSEVGLVFTEEDSSYPRRFCFCRMQGFCKNGSWSCGCGLLVSSRSPCCDATCDVLKSVPAEVILDVDFMQNYLLGKNAFVICQMGASQLI